MNFFRRLRFFGKPANAPDQDQQASLRGELTKKLAENCLNPYSEMSEKQAAWLLSQGADPNVCIPMPWIDVPEYPGCPHFSLLAIACLQKKQALVTVLLRHGADPDLQMAPSGMTALHLCLASDVLWLAGEASVSRTNWHQAYRPPFKIALLLVEQGARTDVSDKEGRTALDMPATCPDENDDDHLRWNAVRERERLDSLLTKAALQTPPQRQRRL